MMDKLVMRWGLGTILALAALPITANAQTAPPPMAPVEPAPVTEVPAPVVEAAPAQIVVTPPPEEMKGAPIPEVVPAAPAEAPAAPAAPAPTVSGFIEAGYSINFSDVNVNDPVPLRVYDPAGHSFVLHAAHLAITHKFNDNVSAFISFDAGRDAVANSANAGFVYPWKQSPQFAFDIQEAYANYASNGFTLTAGKFVTYEGIEVIQGPLNPTISRGYLYGLAEPFTHTGVKLHYQPVDQFNIGIGVVNGWDLITDNNSMKTFIARMAVTPSDKFFAALSGSVGAEQPNNNKNQRISVDLTGAITPSTMFQLWYQFNIGTEKGVSLDPTKKSATWLGFGLQPVVTSGDFTLGGRVEFFDDPQGARTGLLKGKFLNLTATPGIKLADPFKLRAEFRADIGLGDESKIFGKADSPKKVGLTGALSAEYTF
jgi:hypothetical protein